jgi:hypothetical protein
MNDCLDFMVYCLEYYKKDKNINGAQAARIFSEHDVLDYIKSCYGALHTTPPKYIVEDIDGFVLARKGKTDGIVH